MNEKELLNMKLNDILLLPETNFKVIRVFGGWIYQSQNYSDSGVFVPEFRI